MTMGNPNHAHLHSLNVRNAFIRWEKTSDMEQHMYLIEFVFVHISIGKFECWVVRIATVCTDTINIVVSDYTVY